MKKIILALLLGLCLLFAACEKLDVVTHSDMPGEDSGRSMFVEVEDSYNWKIVYHRETRVMYAVSDGVSNVGTFTVLVNADGSPMVWEEGRG